MKLVDTAGQDEYSIFPAQYSMDIHGYVLVYSITSTKSFEVVQIIYEKLLDMTGKIQLVQIFNNDSSCNQGFWKKGEAWSVYLLKSDKMLGQNCRLTIKNVHILQCLFFYLPKEFV